MNSTKKKVDLGKVLLTSIAALTATGGFLADWNRTHLFNPRWPSHAKFHDAMTISLGLMLGSSALYLLHTRGGNSQYKLQLRSALPAFFWGSMLVAGMFPNAESLESEFPEYVPKLVGYGLMRP